ncbi:MAG: hypothetical protein HYY43_02550 [Deltaproteobacteria bacterium]|nr:hypothetical protein [Deltaproteobacteria bacterium]MBI2341712.1 hypothetical protein [Deltaproteobacteria bacterium]MBI2974454.1 hypothetical protein [Deltaproteobacteria bacterium]
MLIDPKVGEILPPHESCQMTTSKGPVLPNEQMVMALEPGIANFFTKVMLYADKNISSDELGYLYASLQEASEFVAQMQGEKFQLNPLYDELEIFYRPTCAYEDEAGKGITYTGGYKSDRGYIVISPLYLNCDYNKPASESIVSILVHELTHTFFSPKFHIDPAYIIEEGLTTYAQHLFATEYGSGYYNSSSDNPQFELTQDFPDKPHDAMMAIDAYAGAEANIVGADGVSHLLYVKKILDLSDQGEKDSFSVTFDGHLLGKLKDSWCSKASDDLLVCASENGEDHKLLIFPSDAEIERVSEFDLLDPSVTPTDIDYAKIKYVFGEDGFGKRRVFERWTGLMNHLTYKFDQIADLLPAENYQAAFLLHTQLERLFWKHNSQTNPDFHPDDYFKKLGEMHNSYVDYIFLNYENKTPSEGCKTGETNIYHGLCNALKLPLDECLGVFQSFGLDTEFNTCEVEWQGVGVGVSCESEDIPPEDEMYDYVDEDEGSSGCSMSLY